MPVLDASFLVDLQRELPAANSALGRLEGAIIPAQSLREFLGGLPDPDAAATFLMAHHRIAWDEREQVVRSAVLYRAARARGKSVSWADAAIAAHADLLGTYVVTANARDFRALGCEVWDYRQQPNPPK